MWIDEDGSPSKLSWTVFWTVLLLLCALGVSAEPLDCIAEGVGVEGLQEAAQSWCDLGTFERVYFEYDPKADRFRSNYTLNDSGYARWIEDTEGLMREELLRRTGELSKLETKVRMQLRYDGKVLIECWNMFIEEGDETIYRAACEEKS
jgi:hypothetical protein